VPIEYIELRKAEVHSNDSFKKAQEIAERFRDFLNEEGIQNKIRQKDVCGALSTEIQEIILPCAKELGFESEARGKFRDYTCKDLRPDYFHSQAGILLEVERGKTRMNNMDLLDMWKCHICDSAKYLFLMIPKVRPNRKGRLVKQFHLTKSRLETFFVKQNYTNVDAVFLFGYGVDG
jgi:hypothetical protein